MFADVEEGSREFEKKRKRLSVSPGVQKIDDLRAKKKNLSSIGPILKRCLKKLALQHRLARESFSQAAVDVRRMAG